MARITVCRDDRTGDLSSDPNPEGWLLVTVSTIQGGADLELAFESWKNFREWVELSDPGCAQVLIPPATKT